MNLTLVAAIALLVLWGILVFALQLGTGPVQVLYAVAVVLFARRIIVGAPKFLSGPRRRPGSRATPASATVTTLLLLPAPEQHTHRDGNELRGSARGLDAHVPALSEEVYRTQADPDAGAHAVRELRFRGIEGHRRNRGLQVEKAPACQHVRLHHESRHGDVPDHARQSADPLAVAVAL